MESQDKLPIGLGLFAGSELTTESFRLAQYDNTYLLASDRYYQFYASYIRPRILMYKGWLQGFHNVEYGVLPSLFLQRIGNGILNTLFSKPIVFNTQNAETAEFISSAQFKKSGFAKCVKEGYGYAIAGGTGLLKINNDGTNTLRFETVPMDRFFIETDAYGDIERVKCFVATYHDTISAEIEYYLCEERFFRYSTQDGNQVRYPMVHYTFYKTSTNIANETTPAPSENIPWKDIPQDIRKMIERDYGNMNLDGYDAFELKERWNGARSDGERSVIYSMCTLLPFDDDLGVRLLKFTRDIPAFPKLPFGQPIADLLMNESYAYDQLKFFERLEVYVARSRVMVDEGQTNPNDPDARKKALDPLVFSYYDNTLGDTKDGKPLAIQPPLRAEEIKTQKQNILNDTAFALNLSSSTIAAWLSDGTTQKTATEIEYERTKTDAFINEKIDIIREPLQELADIYFHFYGLESAEINIMPESQASRTDNIRLYSELYEKGQVPAKMLAEKILGTCSAKEVNELAEHIEAQRQEQIIQTQPLIQSEEPPTSGFFDVNSAEAGIDIEKGKGEKRHDT